jgi:hypothetical protein
VPSNPYIAVFAPSKKSLQRFLLISLTQPQTLEADSFAFSNCSFEVLAGI